MNLNVTNIQIDGENVNEVLWVKSGETSIHTGMTIGTPLKFNVDEYTLENPGETAIITVRTDNNIYKDIELNRCVPTCDCDIFNVVCESRKFVHQTGGTVDFSYSFDPDAVGKCSEETFDCTTKADFVTITHNRENRIFSARFDENFDARRNAKIVFSYGDENCDVFTITQGSLVDNCNKKLTIYKEPSTLTCQGGKVQFSVAKSPIDCNEAIKIKARYNEVEVSNCGGEVQYDVVSTPTPVVCNKYYLINTDTAVIKYEGEVVEFKVETEDGETFNINDLQWSFGNEIDEYEIISENTIAVTFLPNDEHSVITYTVRCEDEHGNCGTMKITQSKNPEGPCSLTKAFNRKILSAGESDLHLFTYSADICSSGNFDISSDLPGVSYNLEKYPGRIYFNIPENTSTEGRDIHITITSRRSNLVETETYTFSQYGKAEQTGIKLILINSTKEDAYISGKVVLFTNRQPASFASSKSRKIEVYFTNTDTESTHNNIKLIPNQELEVSISQENLNLYRDHTYFATNASNLDDFNAIRVYHIRKRPQNITTGVEPAYDLIVADQIAEEIIMGETYVINISEIKSGEGYWNAGTSASYPQLMEQSENKIKFKYEDGTCGTAIRTLGTDGEYMWQDNDYKKCN